MQNIESWDLEAVEGLNIEHLEPLEIKKSSRNARAGTLVTLEFIFDSALPLKQKYDYLSSIYTNLQMLVFINTHLTKRGSPF